MDEKIFEDWKRSKLEARARARKLPGFVWVLGFLAMAGAGLAGLGGALAIAPTTLVEVQQGEARRWLDKEDGEILILLSGGDRTEIHLPDGETLRSGAKVRVELLQKSLGPFKVQWRRFAGYAEP